jgi:hypothetical protein
MCNGSIRGGNEDINYKLYKPKNNSVMQNDRAESILNHKCEARQRLQIHHTKLTKNICFSWSHFGDQEMFYVQNGFNFMET